MSRHIFEQQEIGLICLLKTGKAAGSAVTFVLFQDGIELERIEGQVVADKNARAGKAATAKYTPKDVPADKPSYLLTYKAIADGDEYRTSDQIHVWPKKGKLTALRKDDGKPFPGFKFKVMQNGAQVGPIYTVETDQAVAEFKLDKGSPFALVGAEPYEIKSTEKNGTALRDLKAKGVIHFNAEFVKPKRPANGQIKQWVNLDADATAKGTDGNGYEVELEVGVLGDRDAATGATKAEADRLGKAGLFVFIKVTFSGPNSKKSKRNDPKTDLVDGLDLTDRTAVKEAATDPVWEFKGKVELKSPDGVGRFKVNLGKAGGDTCTIELGSTEALGGPKLTFTNWRKIWYELMAPDFMQLENRTLSPGVTGRDFAAAGRANIKASGDKTFIEYELYKSHSFTEAECPADTVMKREFFEYTTGNAKVYVLTDDTFKKYPKNFDKGKGSRATCIKACDINLYSDGPGTDDPIDRAFDATTVRCTYDIWGSDPDIYWLPKSGYDGTDTIKRITWAAKIANPATYKARPRVEFDADENTGAGDDSSERTIAVRETLQNRGPVNLTYTKALGMIGNVATDLDAAAKAALDGLLGQIYSVPATRPQIGAIRAQGNKLKFKLTGLLGNARRTERFQKIKDYLTRKVAASGPEIPTHPGLDDVGDPRQGVLTWSTVVDMDRSHHHKFVINLPAANNSEPGTFVGALSATRCPVTVTIRWEPHHGGNGLAGQGAQRGEILIRWGINCPLCITDTFLHELGHQYNLSVVAQGALTDDLDNHVWPNADAVHAPGLPVPKTIAENETNAAYRHNGTKGHCYSRRAHSGSHCAWGLSDAEKANPGDTNGVCTEYGSGPRDDTRRTRLSFCKQCIDYIRARDLSALK